MENVETVMNEVPALGQHTDAILGEIGFDAEIIAGWRREKMI
jgi:crotonobetainyl-CoA:carnitine CoA-transferase CaiB-like acyl-CoA transferase